MASVSAAPKAYSNDKTPFTEAHEVGKANIIVKFNALAAGFTPANANISVGDQIADLRSGCFGPCGKISKKYKNKKGTFYTITGGLKNGRNKISTANDCIKLHAVNEYIRNKNSKCWYKVIGYGKNNLICAQVFEKQGNQPKIQRCFSTPPLDRKLLACYYLYSVTSYSFNYVMLRCC